MLLIIVADVQADEVIIQDQIARHEDRLRSYELLASVSNLITQDPAPTRVASES